MARPLTPDEQAWCDYADEREKAGREIGSGSSPESSASFVAGRMSERARAVTLAEEMAAENQREVESQRRMPAPERHGYHMADKALREFVRKLKEEG